MLKRYNLEHTEDAVDKPSLTLGITFDLAAHRVHRVLLSQLTQSEFLERARSHIVGFGQFGLRLRKYMY